MRLTLRTMLAYMDGILDPEDAEKIGKKLDESEFAANLLHRTRDVMRRLRLAAPKLADGGQGLDANTVAEYLDNTLHHDRVTDFEKICLDSDVHLAEVAACHQILALVLGEAAEIDPTARGRMYGLPERPAEQPADESAATVVPPPVQAPSDDGSTRLKPSVPDYLRDPPKKRRFLPVAAALALVACFAVVVLIAMGQFEPDQPLGRALAKMGFGEEPDQVADAPDDERDGDKPDDVESNIRPDAPGDDAPGDDAPGDDAPGDDVPGDDAPGDDAPGDDAPGDDVPGDVAPGDDAPGDDAPGDDVPPEPAELLPMGRFMSADQILLRHDPTLRIWHRVSGKEILYPGHRLIALPTYRDEIVLSAGITVQLLGGTQIELLPSGALQPAGLKVHFGRALIMPLAEAGKRLTLAVGRRRGVLTLPDPRSSAALEVELIRAPGTDPEVVEATAIAYLYAKAGEVTWEEPDLGQPVTITVGQVLVLDGRPVPVPAVVETAPAWLSGDDTGSLEMGADRLASVTLEKELRPEEMAGDGGRPKGMHLRLVETYHDARSGRRRENRWLAARSLGYVGDFGPLITALNEPEHPPVWMDETIEHLRAAVARSPEMATLVRQTLEKQYGEDGTGLFRMLWGYTQQGLRSSEAKKLVEGLDHESLAVRALSFWNLRDIFGLGLQYKPHDTAARRRTPTQKWRQRLESGEIWEKLPDKSSNPPQGGRRTF